MLKLKIFDSLFSHDKYSCSNCKSNHLQWIQNPLEVNDGDVVFFTDLDLNKVLTFKELNIINL